MKAIVLAAGMGSRLGELTEHTPKPMVKVAGRPILDRTLRWLAFHGVQDVAINLHHLGEVIEDHVGDGTAYGLRVRYSREAELRGTAGALEPLKDFLSDGPFYVVYGDNVLDFDLARLREAHASTAAVATLALFSLDLHPHTDLAAGRVEMDRSGRILRFVEGDVDPGLRLVNAGCYVVEPSLLDHVGGPMRDFGNDLFPRVLRNQGILGGHLIDGVCLGVDTPEALARAQRFFEEGVVRDPS